MSAIKYYQIDIAAPSEISSQTTGPKRNRHDLPAWVTINRRWRSMVTRKSVDTMLCYEDFPDKRQVFMKTDREDQVENFRKLPGVSVSEVAASGYYLISGTTRPSPPLKLWTRLKEEILNAISREENPIWTRLKKGILSAIGQYDPQSLQYMVDNDGPHGSKGVIIKTTSAPLVQALSRLSHVIVDELPPGTTEEVVYNIFRGLSDCVSAQKPAEIRHGDTTPKLAS